MLPSHNKWRTEGHDTGDPSDHGVDVHALTLITKLRRGAAASLGLVAPVNSDPFVPTNVVGPIQAKVGHVWCVVGEAMQDGQSEGVASMKRAKSWEVARKA